VAVLVFSAVLSVAQAVSAFSAVLYVAQAVLSLAQAVLAFSALQHLAPVVLHSLARCRTASYTMLSYDCCEHSKRLLLERLTQNGNVIYIYIYI
jgi:uncharacterized protein with beta-barrel porin domain